MQRLLSLFLVSGMLVGSVGVTVNRHFCMGELQSIALFAAADACSKQAVSPCSYQAKLKKKGCCNDEHEFVQWDNDRQLTDVPTLPAFHPVVLTEGPAFPEFALHLRARSNKTLQNYRPPPIVIDVPIHWQVFRL